jgi:tetratricopeptide (TPR) repeat protein
MPRFSAKAKEIFDAIFYHTDIVKANELLEELEDPLDIAFGKLFIAWEYWQIKQTGKLLEIITEVENENKRLNDQFIQFKINFLYYAYYDDMDLLRHENKEQAEYYFNLIEQSYQDIDYKDDWEKYYCIGMYYFSKPVYYYEIRDDTANGITHQKQVIEAWSKMLEDGEYVSALGHIALGGHYSDSGDFEEAEKSWNRVLDACKKYNNLWQFWPLRNLSDLNFMRGDLQKAKELNQQRLDLVKGLDTTYDCNVCWLLCRR